MVTREQKGLGDLVGHFDPPDDLSRYPRQRELTGMTLEQRLYALSIASLGLLTEAPAHGELEDLLVVEGAFHDRHTKVEGDG
jgi:hypothetical protein